MNNCITALSSFSNFVHLCFVISIFFVVKIILKELLDIHRSIHSITMKLLELSYKKNIQEIDEHFKILLKESHDRKPLFRDNVDSPKDK